MATAESVKAKLQGLIDSVNEVTGGDDADLTSAVNTLCEGYGAGEDCSAELLNGTITEYENADVTNVRSYGFYQCKSLKKIVLPGLSDTIESSGCASCSALELFDMYGATIGSSAFRNCSNLKTLIIRRTDKTVSLTATSCFSSTPFASNGSGGTVYVPSALIGAYQTASNWSALYEGGKCAFVAIEGSQYET